MVDPRSGLKEVLVRVRAARPRSIAAAVGDRQKLGVVPLSDGAGEVAAIGDGVTRLKLGDRVIGTFHPRWFGGPLGADYLTDRLGANLDGMLAEYAVLSEEALVPAPPRPRSCPGNSAASTRLDRPAGCRSSTSIYLAIRTSGRVPIARFANPLKPGQIVCCQIRTYYALRTAGRNLLPE